MKQLVQYDISAQVSEERKQWPYFLKKKNNAYVTWMQKGGIMLLLRGETAKFPSFYSQTQ